MRRGEAVATLLSALDGSDVLISTTGLISRQVFASGDRPRNFYMLGSMGLASALGLGLAKLQPSIRVVILEGDGSALMSLGTLPLIATEAPSNLLHVILDNGVYESTGAQPSIAGTVSLSDIAGASGYGTSVQASSPDQLRDALASFTTNGGPALVVARVAVDTSQPPPRVSLTPVQIRDRLIASLAAQEA